MQEIRIRHRWEAMNIENQLIMQAKREYRTYIPKLMPNGDSIKQLLPRSRYVVYKSRQKWPHGQNKRAQMLFGLYPDIKKRII